MRFHETNDISRNFSCITLDFREIVKYFVLCFCFWYFRKMTAKCWFLLNRFEMSKFCTFWWQKLKKSISQLPNTTLFGWKNQLVKHLGWKSIAHIPSPNLAPVSSIDANITPSDVSTNWYYYYHILSNIVCTFLHGK
jgi:hypothetical protein